MYIPNQIRWVRSEQGWFAGVCAGLAESFDVEPWVLRALFVISFFWFGTGLLFYLLAAISLPRKDKLATAYNKRIAGVCAELAIKHDFEVGLVRMLACFLAVSSFGLTIFGYILLAALMPKVQMQLTRKV